MIAPLKDTNYSNRRVKTNIEIADESISNTLAIS
jgi:hypothetical protein